MANNNGLIQKSQENKVTAGKPQTIKEFVKSMELEIKKALPSVITPERFTRIVFSALSATPQLNECTPQSFLGAMMSAAQLGLEPNTPLGQAYLIPFKNNKKGIVECQFQLGYKGILDLAYRSGEVSMIQAHIAYENDEFSFEYGLNPDLKHVPAMENRGEAKWVYAMFKLQNGGYGFEVMSIADVRAHAKRYSQSYNSGFSPWATNFEEMAKKTVLKKVLKYAPLKSDFVRQTASDETIKVEISDDMSTVPPAWGEEVVDVEEVQTAEVTE
jgi:recombination protein RecT